MKRILPILTLALLGAAASVQVSAQESPSAPQSTYYYDYYRDASVSDLTYNKVGPGNFAPDYYTDTTTYKDFQVVRNTNWYVDEVNLAPYMTQSNFYRIHILGDEGTKVNLYLTDYVDNAGSDNNASALYRNIEKYGYRKLQEVTMDGKTQYIASNAPEDTVIYDVNGKTVKDSVHITKEQFDDLGAEIIDPESYDVTRYQYSLGTFTAGDVIELYMKDSANADGVFSYSGFNEVLLGNDNVGAMGGFGDGGLRLSEHTDEMLNGYYFQDDTLEELGYDELKFGNNTAGREAASSLAMPLSTLVPSEGKGVYFGIIATAAGIIDDNNGTGGGDGDGNGGTSGSPLPGGLPIALVAGLFALGFWFVRRRKITVA